MTMQGSLRWLLVGLLTLVALSGGLVAGSGSGGGDSGWVTVPAVRPPNGKARVQVIAPISQGLSLQLPAHWGTAMLVVKIRGGGLVTMVARGGVLQVSAGTLQVLATRGVGRMMLTFLNSGHEPLRGDLEFDLEAATYCLRIY